MRFMLPVVYTGTPDLSTGGETVNEPAVPSKTVIFPDRGEQPAGRRFDQAIDTLEAAGVVGIRHLAHPGLRHVIQEAGHVRPTQKIFR